MKATRLIQADGGYTLMELLIAMALVAFLSAGLLASVGSGTRIWESSELRSARQSESSVLETTLRQHIERAVPGLIVRDGRAHDGVFEGTARTLRLLTSTEAGGSGSGLFVEEMEIERRGDEYELVVRRARAPIELTGDETRIARDESAIPLGATEPEFRYFGTPGVGQDDAWHPEWRSAAVQPKLIGLFFSDSREGDDVRDIIVAPRRELPALMIGEAELSRYLSAMGN